MKTAGGIVALIAGIFCIFSAGATLIIGGVGSAVNVSSANTVIGLGWGGVIFSFTTIVFAAIALGLRSRVPGILLVLNSIAGAILGGTLVAIFMALALIGGVLVIFGGGKKKVPSITAPTNLGDKETTTMPVKKSHKIRNIALIAIGSVLSSSS